MARPAGPPGRRARAARRTPPRPEEVPTRLAVSKLSALRALRLARSSRQRLPLERRPLPEPSPEPGSRWTARLVPYERLALERPPSPESPIDVVVPTRESRLRARFLSCTTRLAQDDEPSFVGLGDGLFIPCPELLFLELASVMEPEVHALLGYELCGSFSRDPRDPRFGPVTYDIEPVTTVGSIAAYLDRHAGAAGVRTARENLALVADNAWSATESVVAMLAKAPLERLGYGFDGIALNRRREVDPALVALGARASRVPDIEVLGTHGALNYDGGAHLDLESVAAAARDGEAGRAMRSVREKSVDDLRRNRELAAMGVVALTVTSEDLFARGGLDAVMLELAMTLEWTDGRSAETQRRALASRRVCRERQNLIWSLLPWREGPRLARAAVARLEGMRPVEVADELVPF